MNNLETDGGSGGSSPAFHHQPVMMGEIVELFETVPAGFVLDATLGGGGHAEAILDRHPRLSILGIDRDQTALAAASHRLARFGDRVRTVHSRFDRLQTAMNTARINELSGALFDLGVSSPQLDRAERGFSYRHDAPLDMRMDTTEAWSGRDVVNGSSEAELIRVLQENGDERFASRIAKAIIAQRPIESTAELADIIVAAIPAAARRTGGHPAKRSFQAIRIEVNRELEILPDAIDDAIASTIVGGRIAILSYHSGEDRIVKERFRAAETGNCICPRGLPCVCGAVRTVRLVRRVPKTPSAAEIASNRRAASARLRGGRADRSDPRRRLGGLRRLGALSMSSAAPLRHHDEERVRPSDLRRAPLERRGPGNAVRSVGRPDEGSAPAKPHLEVVPRRGRALSIVAVCCLLLFGLLLGAVAFQTKLAQNQLALDKVERDVTAARSRYDVLRRQRAELRSPDRLAVEAKALGMSAAVTGEFMTIDPSVVAAVTASASNLPGDVSNQKTSNFDQFGEVKAVTADTP